MVDYNNDTTLATPSVDINRVQILERRAYVIESLEEYYRFKLNGAGGNDKVFRSRLASLYWELQETLYRKFEPGVFENMKKVLFSANSKHEDILVYWNKINMLLGQINLTKIDTKKEYDTTDLEAENSEHGM
jgi:hypothetical protein